MSSTRRIFLKVPQLTITLEASVTGVTEPLVGGTNARKIRVTFPTLSVSKVSKNADGSGTNYWNATLYEDQHIEAHSNIIVLGDQAATDIGGAATVVYVTYIAPAGDEPLVGAWATDGSGAVLAESWGTGITANMTGHTEMTDIVTGTPLEFTINPSSGGMVIKSLKVLTDGTDIDVFIYSAATANYANLLYQTYTVNQQFIDNSEWVIPAANTSVWIGYVDAGANATEANTTIYINGTPLV